MISGGRNEELYGSINNVALNDYHLYDLKHNAWCVLALYGDIPSSRWGHMLVGEGVDDIKKDRVLMLGGVNLNSYCDSTIYEF